MLIVVSYSRTIINLTKSNQGIEGDISWRDEGEVIGICPDIWLMLRIGAKGIEYPKRFFARDYAGNRLEFSI